MKTSKIKLIIAVVALQILSTSLFAENNTCYKGVCIKRGDTDKNCVYATNDNSYDAFIQFEYKVVSDRNAPWINYPGRIEVSPRGHVGAIYTKLRCIDSEIKALRITYVDVRKPSVGEEVMKVLVGE